MNTQTEEWRPIKGFEGYFEISNFGRVKSLGNGKAMNPAYNVEHIRKPGVDQRGYLLLTLQAEGKKITRRIHRLVAEAFLPNPDPEHLTTINHIDYDKTNNKLSNLEWMSNADNIRYSKAKKVIAENINTHEQLTFNSTIEASQYFFNNNSSISTYVKKNILFNKTWRFKYDI